MKRVCLMVLSLLVLSGVQVYGAQFGPMKAATEANGFHIGLGYAYQPDEWDAGLAGLDRIQTKQHQVYLQAGGTIGSRFDWFAQGGVANWIADDAFRFSDEQFDGDVMPVVGGGMSLLLRKGETVSVGPFVQGSYTFLEYEDNNPGTGTHPVTGLPISGKEFVYLKNVWELDAGVKFQVNIEGAALYFGPAFYLVNGEYRSNFGFTGLGTDAKTADAESANKFGAFAGVQWLLDEHYVFSLEAQYKGEVAASGVLSYRF